ncbi:transmembrane sensor [Herbaspirillum sp. 1173]|uniref:FecR domain-containing protein n=1 Tax=Herbaspirillum sp. 1173 TaxID=2817734 RepID=UPI002865E10D|nr:FecR domain-containing protein [Herbaspirillum sp. 1173]MDR6741098.1 transmembrane sensor [Herbaspirillum sp. 1173]
MGSERTAPNDDIVMAAIDWMVRLQSGSATDHEHEACRRWRAEQPQHELAWQRLQSLSERVATLPRALAHGSIGASEARTRNNRRFALKTLCVATGAGLLAASAARWTPWQAWMAGYTTRTGERRRITLADGTLLQLNSATAVDVSFDEQQRLIRLFRGEVLITTGHEERPSYRPFLVQTRLGQARALGTRFQLRDAEEGMRLAVYEGAVEFRSQNENAPVRVDAGRQGLFDAQGLVGRLLAANEQAIAWTDGVIVADRMPLGQLVAELDRYLPGKLRCDPAVAGLTISGVFPLDQPARILAAIARTLPVRVDSFTDYWITLRPRTDT